MRKMTFVLLVLLAVRPSSARILNVPSEYPTIQAGIDASVSGDTVLVAPGVYIENPLIQGKNISLFSAEGPGTTMIQGLIVFQGIEVDTTCVLKGIKIIWGFGIDVRLIEINSASPLVTGCILIGSWTAQITGIKMINSQAIIRSCIISNCTSTSYAYGIKSDSGYPIIENNIITGNSSGAGDHGVIGWGIEFDTGILRYNIIYGNGASTYYAWANGGGILSTGGPGCHIYNNTIVHNWAWSGYHNMSGGGISFSKSPNDSDVKIENNIIAFNNGPIGARGHITDPTWTDWNYNLVYGNDTIDYYGINPGPHDIQADPMFTNRDSSDFHLLPGSPCIDAGDPSSPLDPDSTRADIGAYFFDQSVGIDEPGPSGPYRFALSQNYPNPFNAETIISYTLDKEATVSLRIMAITGQLVRTLVSRQVQPAGKHRLIWDGCDKDGKPVSTGIYFYELYVDDYRESKAMILVR